ncbi:3-hydroxyacyl-CoA dehydrogenase/enoyl-CoA hydratase/3-hydroxybutyryl-CoA epimerase [Actinoplanes campanulatus]|uniref:3-hydroxyacyl-CoA dehydrogenase/enoyl-CoA hydratase/3-hydroxybutyryl-CoA epimerase n=1 Tax=Actinoplanes campanulatus TaxID=113559 RepID=A0A7W5FF91_9ACTN|nr:3-hydroxyacyl-CoA dehydrogenase NAD-binding domain-containing protein [Actinoplanes campanulatus]MBB3096264.1 3-hydroxyacyl-CoA dehydrogenase/enoyl-CoA hydratase/3-hydroxybutyryl-CoA epimerase [Actinoplanes campanulatus]GGN19563.1 3-hydroxyacyl-CoA dehydrogenase [Actinoplanes campanulatus]GID41644.1 3-hydroxyacyl-CoA dehydrogenase [Actinoplanes campanulatus]
MTDTIRYDRGDDGIVVLTLDDPRRGANTMNDAYVASMEATVSRLEAERDQITGVIITSAKNSWFAGGDLDQLGSVPADRGQDVFDLSTRVKGQLRRLETLGKPVVAAINGSALGGGLELALSCHRRIALNNPKTEIGLPEVTLGLLPAGGGVVRTVRLLGLVNALTQVLLQGTRHRIAAALKLGLVDQVVDTPEELIAAAREWIAANPAAAQPWDTKGYKIPGGTPSTPALASMLPAFPANLRKQLKGAFYPAPRNILSAAVEGAQVDVDNAFVIETRYFVELVTGPVAKNMIKAFFFDLNEVSQRDIGEVPPITKVAVLGAGMMGAAIAYVCARAGLPVVLRDVSLEGAVRGKGYSEKIVAKDIGRGRISEDKGRALLDLITATDQVADLAGADLVIEAVFEDPALKHKVFAEIEGIVAPDALLCSNTSTLPITALADGVQRQADFIGLHFFSPVDKMPLVEVIKGEKTSDLTVRRALDVVRRLRKTPIVVNDSRGFFTSRVIGTFTNEGIAMLAEGVAPASIEQASSQAGYPAPVLQLMDELTLTLPRKIRNEYRAAASAAGQQWEAHPADEVIDRMIDEFGRPGRSGGAGFYEYADGRRTGLWAGLSTFAKPDVSIPFEDLKERMLFIEAIETVKCLDEGVLLSVAEANIGSIFGIGYPGWTGGVLQYINQYEGGLPGFVARARQLAERYGDRFTPPPLLIAKADAGEIFA